MSVQEGDNGVGVGAEGWIRVTMGDEYHIVIRKPHHTDYHAILYGVDGFTPRHVVVVLIS